MLFRANTRKQQNSRKIISVFTQTIGVAGECFGDVN